MNREWTAEDELRHENRRLASEVAELRVRAEAAEAWCASWKRGAGINAREIERLRLEYAGAFDERDLARAEVERLTSERAMRIERDGLLAAERQRFAVAYDAVQQMHRERGEARAEVERLTNENAMLRDTEDARLVVAERERDEARADLRDLSEAVKAAWHQCNSAGLTREQYATLHRAFEIAVARQVG